MMIVGHRGARELWPENSREGFEKLLALGVEAVEFDVHQTRDGGAVVIHDPTLERTTLGTGPVGAKRLAELADIRLRDSAETVPDLDSVLAILAPSRLELHIEIKTDTLGQPYGGLEQRVVETVERHGLADRAVYTCFAPDVVETVRALRPLARVLVSLDRRSAEMMGGLDKALDRLVQIPDCLVAVEKALLALSFEQCRARLGADRLGVWTVNAEEEIAFWLAQPLRQITTDRPDLALRLR